MTLSTHEFIRRFLMHVLPKGFHRIRHYGLLASGNRAANIARARELLAVPVRSEQNPRRPKQPDEPRMLPRPCPCCGGRMIIIETFARGCEPKHRATARSGRDQDRHLMMPSSLIQHRTEARHSGRLPPGSTPACADQPDWPVIAPPILSSNMRSACSRRRAYPNSAKADRRQRPLKLPQPSRRRQIPIAPAAPSVPHIPRFRALALFGRRPPSVWMVRHAGIRKPAQERTLRTYGPPFNRRELGLTIRRLHQARRVGGSPDG